MLKQWIEYFIIKKSGLLDPKYYLLNNPDVRQADIDPLKHFIKNGWKEGKNPSDRFITSFYLSNNPDVAKSRINPLIHYLRYGKQEGRHPNPLSDSSVSISDNADVSKIYSLGNQVIVKPEDEASPTLRLAYSTDNPISVSIVIPTKNAGTNFKETLEAINNQIYSGPVELVVIDSGSTDNTISLASEYSAAIVNISPHEFDHGLTRNHAIDVASGEIIILMSQDVLPGNQHLVHNFVSAFENSDVAGAYARQIPREDADVITKRNLNNWLTGREENEIRSIKNWNLYLSQSPMDRYKFCNFDNVCSAIRKNVWESIPFQANQFGEDIEWSQQVLEAGWKIAYWPACFVFHSHERSIKYEYDRSHLCHKKLFTQFGIQTIPSLFQVLRSTLISIYQDRLYVVRHERKLFDKLSLLMRIPLLSFASVYGQYTGAKAGRKSIIKVIPKSEKLRIILTVHQFLPDFSSGTEILTFETAKRLKELGHEVTVFTGFPNQKLLEDSERFDSYSVDGIKVIRFHHDQNPMGNQSNVMEMEYDNHLFEKYFKNFLRYEKPDIVHFFHLMRLSASAIDACHELGIPTALTPTDFWFICPTCQLRLPNNKNCKGPDALSINCLRHIVINSQSTSIITKFKYMPNWLLASVIILIRLGINFDGVYSPMVRALSKRQRFLMQQLNHVGRVVIPTKIMLSMLNRNGLNISRTTILPYGLNISFHKEPQRKKSNKLRLAYIGTLYEHKGVHILVEAVKRLEDKPIELKIYGGLEEFPNYVEDLRKIASDDSRIQFCGRFSNSEIGKIFSDMDALVVPSIWYENTPLVVYSAQAAGCPVIASDVEGISEFIEHEINGLLFEKGDVFDLVSTLNTLLDNKNILLELSRNSKMPLTIPEYTEKHISIYSDLLQPEENG